MANFKSKVIKLAISGVAIFVFGLFIGYQLNTSKISSIHGYLFNAAGEANGRNATHSNATHSNATHSNATHSNATHSNATHSNATQQLFLDEIVIKKPNVKVGDFVDVIVITRGAFVQNTTITFKTTDGKKMFVVDVGEAGGVEHIFIPAKVSPGRYVITDVTLKAINNDNTTITKHFSKKGVNKLSFNAGINIIAKGDNNEAPKPRNILNSIKLVNEKVKSGDRVYIELKSSEKVKELKLIFTSYEGKTFEVPAQDIKDNKAYFEVPMDVANGRYMLTGAILSNESGAATYTKDGKNNTEKFLFNSYLEIVDFSGGKFSYNNEDLTNEVLNKLLDAPSGSEIVINADSNTLISEKLFNTIKGKNTKLIINHSENQIIFNGKDIDNLKTIDIKMTVDGVISNEKIKKLISNGIVVNFPDNGNLPGKALIRVKATDKVSKVLNNNVYVYIYNELTKNFTEIDTDVTKSKDDYYEFYINHNSDFLIVNEKLDTNLVVSRKDNHIVSFQKGNKTLIMLILIGIIVIIAAIVLVIFLKNSKEKMSKDDMNDFNNI